MNNGDEYALAEGDLGSLAQAAGLNLEKGREAVVHPILDAWLRDARELNRKMSRREHWAIVPLTVFTHPRR